MAPDKQPIISISGNAALRDFALQDGKRMPSQDQAPRCGDDFSGAPPVEIPFAKIAIESAEVNVLRGKRGDQPTLPGAAEKGGSEASQAGTQGRRNTLADVYPR